MHLRSLSRDKQDAWNYIEMVLGGNVAPALFVFVSSWSNYL